MGKHRLFTMPTSTPSSANTAQPATISGHSISKTDFSDRLSPFCGYQGRFASKVALGFGDCEAKASLPWHVLLGHVIAVKQQPRLNPHLIQCAERTGHSTLGYNSVPNIANRRSIGKNRIAAFAGIAGARQAAGMAEQPGGRVLEIAKGRPINIAVCVEDGARKWPSTDRSCNESVKAPAHRAPAPTP